MVASILRRVIFDKINIIIVPFYIHAPKLNTVQCEPIYQGIFSVLTLFCYCDINRGLDMLFSSYPVKTNKIELDCFGHKTNDMLF